METNVFDFTLFFSSASLFSCMISYKFPLTWAVGGAHFLRNLPSLKNIQFDWSQFEWFDNPENMSLSIEFNVLENEGGDDEDD